MFVELYLPLILILLFILKLQWIYNLYYHCEVNVIYGKPRSHGYFILTQFTPKR